MNKKNTKTPGKWVHKSLAFSDVEPYLRNLKRQKTKSNNTDNKVMGNNYFFIVTIQFSRIKMGTFTNTENEYRRTFTGTFNSIDISAEEKYHTIMRKIEEYLRTEEKVNPKNNLSIIFYSCEENK